MTAFGSDAPVGIAIGGGSYQLGLELGDIDPLNPDWEIPTPIDLVLRLPLPQRMRRVERLVEMAYARYQATLDGLQGKNVVAVCGLFSGGKDSSTAVHIFRPVLTHLLHANTETGLEATREFVRTTARNWNLPLLEKRPKPGQGYWDMVRGTILTKDGLHQPYPGGFPGPAMHHFMYTRLKERGLEAAKHDLYVVGSRVDRAIYIAGRRRAESRRRADIPHHESWGSVEWSSPLAIWHKADLLTYRLMHAGCPPNRCTAYSATAVYPTAPGPVPTNPHAERLGISGECGCGSNARPGEREKWLETFPNDPFLQRVLAEEEVLAVRTDLPEHVKRWCWGATYDSGERPSGGRLCGKDCGIDPLLDLMDPLFHLDAGHHR
jgi:3'-phosphoadenosine 5'-phosphosulfate sulfotransferase (PAPS reductase)/FAD synthetase